MQNTIKSERAFPEALFSFYEFFNVYIYALNSIPLKSINSIQLQQAFLYQFQQHSKQVLLYFLYFDHSKDLNYFRTLFFFSKITLVRRDHLTDFSTRQSGSNAHKEVINVSSKLSRNFIINSVIFSCQLFSFSFSHFSIIL